MEERLEPDAVVHEAGVEGADDRYRSIVERMPLVVYTHDGGRPPAMTYVSPQIERILGFSAGSWVGQPHFWVTRIDPEDRERVLAAIDEACLEGRGLELEYRWRTADDRTLWVRDELAPVRDDDGRISFWQGTIADVSSRVAAEEALRRSERRGELLVESVTDHAMLMLDEDGTIVAWNPGAERLFGYAEPEALGKNVAMLLSDERGPDLVSELRTAVGSGRAESEGWRIRKDGSRFWGHAITTPIRDGAGRLVGLARVTRDLTERREAARLLAQRVRQQAAVAEVGMRALGRVGPEPLLDEATHVAARTLDMPIAALFLAQDEHLPVGTAPLLLAYGTGWRPDLVGTAEVMPETGGVLWYTVVAGEPVLVPDPALQVARSMPPMLLEHGAMSCASVPLRVGGRVAGALLVAADRELALGDSEVYFLRAITNVVGSFLERHRADQELRAVDADRTRLLARVLTTQEEERAHVARELHDDLAQTLAGIGLFAASLSLATDGQHRETSEQIAAMAQEAADAVRRLIGDLRPLELEDGFAHAAARLTEAAGARRGVEVAFRLEGEPVRLADEVEVAVYRIAQEALQNVAKHAPDAPATVTLRYLASTLEVDVADDGPGFEPGVIAQAGGEHVGLLGMHERAALVGAMLEVLSTPGIGTLVRLKVPVDANVKEERLP